MRWGGWGRGWAGCRWRGVLTVTLLTTGAPDDVFQKRVLRCHQPSLAPRHPGSKEQRPGSAAGEGGLQEEKVEQEEEKVEEKIEPKEEGARRRRRGPLTVSPARPGWAALGRRTRQFMVVALPRPPLPRLWRCRARGSGTAGSAGHNAPAPPPLSLSRRCWCWSCRWGCCRGGGHLGAGSAFLPLPRPSGPRKQEKPTQSPLYCPFLSPFPHPPLWRGWFRVARLSPTSARLRARWPLFSSRRSRLTLAVQWVPEEGEKVGRGRQDAKESNRQSEGVTSPFLLPRSRVPTAPGNAAAGAEVLIISRSSPGWERKGDWLGGARGRREATWRCYCPPLGLGSRSLTEELSAPALAHALEPEPHKVRAQSWGVRGGGGGVRKWPLHPRLGLALGGALRLHWDASQGCGAQRRAASPAAAKLRERLHLMKRVGEEGD